MPTQAELDKQQNRTKSQSGTIGVVAKSGGIYDLSTTTYKPKQENPQTGKRNIQDTPVDGARRDRVEKDTSGGGTFTLDVVTDDNEAGTAEFNGGGVQ